MTPFDMLLSLVTNKYVLGIVGAILGIFYVYSKGKSSGKDSVLQAEQQARERMIDDVRMVEKNNQDLEKEKQDAEQKASDAGVDVDRLSSLLNSFGTKTDGDSSDKK
jgi:Tfp pilus assembly protein PilN